MIELDTILEEWKEDSKLSTNQLDEDSRVTPALHAKYLEYLSLTKLRLKKAEFKQKELLKDKWMYYEGKMSKEEINAKGWQYDPYEGHNITTKASKEHWYDTDTDIQQSEERIVYFKTMIDTLTEIVDNLKWRHQTIGNIIKWRSFQEGL
tara:strand:- start:258 stop:707 length:450 start_codon:yes stop_codon:yes gene_type:complete